MNALASLGELEPTLAGEREHYMAGDKGVSESHRDEPGSSNELDCEKHLETCGGFGDRKEFVVFSGGEVQRLHYWIFRFFTVCGKKSSRSSRTMRIYILELDRELASSLQPSYFGSPGR